MSGEMKQFIKTTIGDFLNESLIFKEKDKYKQEYLNYHGNLIGFNDKWEKLTNTNFKDGGLINMPEYVELSRLINDKGEIKKDKNFHWVRTTDEHLFYDKDWIFLVDTKIDKNTKIIRIKTHKSNIDMEKTIIQNLTFDYEGEITLKNINIIKYDVINY